MHQVQVKISKVNQRQAIRLPFLVPVFFCFFLANKYCYKLLQCYKVENQ